MKKTTNYVFTLAIAILIAIIGILVAPKSNIIGTALVTCAIIAAVYAVVVLYRIYKANRIDRDIEIAETEPDVSDTDGTEDKSDVNDTVEYDTDEPEKKENKRSFGWLWTILGIVLGLIIALLLFKGCGCCNSTTETRELPTEVEKEERTAHFDTAYIDHLVVGDADIEKADFEDAEFENAEIENATAENVDVDIAFVDNMSTKTINTDKVISNEVVTPKVITTEVVAETVKTEKVEAVKVETEELVVANPVCDSVCKAESTSEPAKEPVATAPVHTHSYKWVEEPADCETNGKKTRVCDCGLVAEEVIVPATGHNWDNGKITKEATENVNGIKTFTCTTCGAEKHEKVEKLAHVHDCSWKVALVATCEKNGREDFICKSCGEVVDSRIIPATGHNWNNGKVTTKATETRKGIKTFTCTACGETYEESIPKLEHKHEYDWEVTREATCTRDGLESYICSDCGEVKKTRTIKATGHNYQLVSHKEPTATRDGYDKYRCTECGDTYTDEIPATGNSYNEPTPVATKVTLTATRALITSDGTAKTERLHDGAVLYSDDFHLMDDGSMVGNQVTITTTGKASDLVLDQNRPCFQMQVVNSNTVVLTVIDTTQSTTANVYDNSGTASISFSLKVA